MDLEVGKKPVQHRWKFGYLYKENIIGNANPFIHRGFIIT